MPRKGSAVQAPPSHKEIKVPSEVLQRYVGSYQLRPNVELVVTLGDGQLGVQLTGQQRLPVFPEAEDKFFLKVVEAQLEFVRDAGGAVTSVILHQNGMDQTFTKE